MRSRSDFDGGFIIAVAFAMLFCFAACGSSESADTEETTEAEAVVGGWTIPDDPAAADLPDEPLPGLPLIEVAGDRRVLIEHHCGVMEYSTQAIRIKVKYGQICIEGTCLTLTHMTKGQLIISGRIHSIHLLRGCP